MTEVNPEERAPGLYNVLLLEKQEVEAKLEGSLNREEALQEIITGLKAHVVKVTNTTLENKFEEVTRRIVNESMAHGFDRYLELHLEDGIDHYLEHNLDEIVQDCVRNMSFSVSVDH